MGNVQSDKVFLSTRLRCIEMLLAQGGVCFCTVWIELFPDGIAKAAYVEQKHHQRAKPLRAWSWGKKTSTRAKQHTEHLPTIAHTCPLASFCERNKCQSQTLISSWRMPKCAFLCELDEARCSDFRNHGLSRRHEASHSKAFPHATLVRPPMSWCRKPLSHLATFIFGVCIVSQHLSYTSELCSCFLSVLLDIFKCLFSFLFKLFESLCRNSLSFECPHLLSAHLPR